MKSVFRKRMAIALTTIALAAPLTFEVANAAPSNESQLTTMVQAQGTDQRGPYGNIASCFFARFTADSLGAKVGMCYKSNGSWYFNINGWR